MTAISATGGLVFAVSSRAPATSTRRGSDDWDALGSGVVADETGVVAPLFWRFCGLFAREGTVSVAVLGWTCDAGPKIGSGEPAVAGGCQADAVGAGAALGAADRVRDGFGLGVRDGLDGLGDGVDGLGDGVAVLEGVGVGVGVAVAVGVADGVADAVSGGVPVAAPDGDGVAEAAMPGDGLAEDGVAEGDAAAPAEQARVAAAQAARPPRTVSALRPAPANIRPPCHDYPDIKYHQDSKPDIYYSESRGCLSGRSAIVVKVPTARRGAAAKGQDQAPDRQDRQL